MILGIGGETRFVRADLTCRLLSGFGELERGLDRGDIGGTRLVVGHALDQRLGLRQILLRQRGARQADERLEILRLVLQHLGPDVDGARSVAGGVRLLGEGQRVVDRRSGTGGAAERGEALHELLHLRIGQRADEAVDRPAVLEGIDRRDRLDAHLLRQLGILVDVDLDQPDRAFGVLDRLLDRRTGLSHPDRPVGAFLFAGPTGVGKTEVARQLAKVMGVEFLRFDMSEYMERHTVSRLIGAPPGYVGFDQGGLLTDAINKTPHCVLLLDEIEKAHPDLFNILLQVMDHATLTDNNGRKADFRNVIIVMTTNAGAQELARAMIGFGTTAATGNPRSAIDRMFSPEFRNRLSSIIEFASLGPEIVAMVVDKFVAELAERLVAQKVTLEVSSEARKWLAKRGFDPR